MADDDRLSRALSDLQALVALSTPTPTSPIAKQLRRGAAGWQIAEAAQAAVAAGDRHLEAPLREAFDLMFVDPIRADPGCRAKLALVEAFDALDVGTIDDLRRALTHVQLEPSLDEPVDTAPGLRGHAANVLVRRLPPQAAVVTLLPSLRDVEPVTRREAARAIGRAGGPGAEVALRFALMHGDDDPAVIGALCGALLSCVGDDAVATVAAFAVAQPDWAAEACLALVDARLPSATSHLLQLARSSDLAVRHEALRALVLTRDAVALDEVFDQLARGDVDRQVVLAALALMAFDPNVQRRVRVLADATSDGALRSALLAWLTDAKD